MARIATVIVESCGEECPNFQFDSVMLQPGDTRDTCGLTDGWVISELDAGELFPDWCPLPKAEKE